MRGKSTDAYWKRIARSRDEESLRKATEIDRPRAKEALRELDDLLAKLQPLVTSTAVDQLRWLGSLLAEASKQSATQARLDAFRLHSAAFTALNEGKKSDAIKLFIESAALSLRGDSLEDAIWINHVAVVSLFRFGENEAALRASEELIEEAAKRGLRNQHARIGLYEFCGMSSQAPAGDRWTVILARIRSGLEAEGDQMLAALVSAQLAMTLIRGGAYEDGARILADVMPRVMRAGLLGANGKVVPARESRDVLLWRARSLDLRGQESEAEQAYRDHPILGEGPSEGRDEILGYLAQHLIENNRLQDALDLIESEEPQQSQSGALYQALISIIYALLNRPKASAAAARDALAKMEQAPQQGYGISEFERLASEGLQRIEQFYVPDERYWRVHIALVESALIRRDAGSGELKQLSTILNWARETGERELEARCLRLGGEAALAAGDPEAAVRQLEAALECELRPAISPNWEKLSERSGELPGLPAEIRSEQHRRSRLEAGVGTETLLALGRAKAVSGADPTAEWDAAISAAQRRNRRLTLYHGLVAKAHWLAAGGRAGDARPLLDNAISVLENLRADLSNIESQIGVLEDKETAYGELLLSAVESGDGSLAMRLMERAKARALLEEMGGRSSHSPLDDDHEHKARMLRQNLVRSLKAASEGEDVHLGSQLLKDQFASLYRIAGTQKRTKPRPGARAEDVARLSAEGRVVLEYFVADEYVIAVLARDGRIEAPLRLPCTKENLVQLAETLRFEITTRDRCHSLTELYNALIRPLEAAIGGASNVVIVPHGVLHTIPLQALRKPGDQYLIEQVAVRYAPSAAVYLEASWQSSAATGALFMAANRTPYMPLPELSHVTSEVEEAARGVIGAEIRTDMDSLRRHLVRRAGRLDILHLACHGEFDEHDPLMSRIMLADGPLYGYEIERLGFTPRLAVLSACETGVQRRAPGDETFGLVRAFLSRGAECVLATLWRVADESTAILMGSLYRELARNRADVAGALRTAQRELLSMSKYAHPFFWAPYVLIGGEQAPPHRG